MNPQLAQTIFKFIAPQGACMHWAGSSKNKINLQLNKNTIFNIPVMKKRPTISLFLVLFPHKQMLTGSTALTTQGFTLIYRTGLGVLEQAAAQIHSDMLVQFRQIQTGRSCCLLTPTAVWLINLFVSTIYGHFFPVLWRIIG